MELHIDKIVKRISFTFYSHCPFSRYIQLCSRFDILVLFGIRYITLFVQTFVRFHLSCFNVWPHEVMWTRDRLYIDCFVNWPIGSCCIHLASELLKYKKKRRKNPTSENLCSLFYFMGNKTVQCQTVRAKSQRTFREKTLAKQHLRSI